MFCLCAFYISFNCIQYGNIFVKAAYSVTFDIFRNFVFSFKSFVKVELSYAFTINLFTIAENCTEK